MGLCHLHLVLLGLSWPLTLPNTRSDDCDHILLMCADHRLVMDQMDRYLIWVMSQHGIAQINIQEFILRITNALMKSLVNMQVAMLTCHLCLATRH